MLEQMSKLSPAVDIPKVFVMSQGRGWRLQVCDWESFLKSELVSARNGKPVPPSCPMAYGTLHTAAGPRQVPGRSQASPIAYGILHCTLRLFLSLVCLGLFVGGKFGFRIFLHLNCLKCGHVERF